MPTQWLNWQLWRAFNRKDHSGQAGFLWIVPYFTSPVSGVHSSIEKCTSPLLSNPSLQSLIKVNLVTVQFKLAYWAPPQILLTVFFLSPTVPSVFSPLWSTILMRNSVFRVLNSSKPGWWGRSKRVCGHCSPTPSNLSPQPCKPERKMFWSDAEDLPPCFSRSVAWSNVDETMVMTPTRPAAVFWK